MEPTAVRLCAQRIRLWPIVIRLLSVGTILLGSTGRTSSAASNEVLPWIPGSWTLIVLPDTQRYTDTRWDPEVVIFRRIAQWIVDNKSARNIKFVLHEGDITSGNRSTPSEVNRVSSWQVASDAMALLDRAGIPYSLTTGNHDHDQWDPFRNAASRNTSLNDFFPVSRYQAMPTFGGVFETGKTENNYHLFRAEGRDYLVVALEFAPRDEAVAWADKILRQYRDRIALIVTHAYTYLDGTRYDWASKGTSQKINPHDTWCGISAPHDGTENVNDGEELWQKLISRHANVRMVFSGHLPWAGARQVSTGKHGQKVHEMLAAYHDPPEGYLRLLEFLPDGKTVQVKTYSPYLDKYLTEDAQQFILHVAPLSKKGGLALPGIGGLWGVTARRRDPRRKKAGGRRSSLPLFFGIPAVLLSVFMAGCGRQGSSRAIVDGTVSYQGQPIEEGEIRFIPTKETKAPMSGSRIANGKYVVDNRGGIPVGTYHVTITAYRNNPGYRGLADSPRPKGHEGEWPPKQQFLPKKYNTLTELEIIIPPDSGRITHDFDLSD